VVPTSTVQVLVFGDCPPATVRSPSSLWILSEAFRHTASAGTIGTASDCDCKQHCAHSSGNLRKAWAALFALGKHSDGRAAIARSMKLCGGNNALANEADVNVLAQWAQSAWDYMAMVRSAPSEQDTRYVK
jgi:hypothetical protein